MTQQLEIVCCCEQFSRHSGCAELTAAAPHDEADCERAPTLTCECDGPPPPPACAWAESELPAAPPPPPPACACAESELPAAPPPPPPACACAESELPAAPPPPPPACACAESELPAAPPPPPPACACAESELPAAPPPPPAETARLLDPPAAAALALALTLSHLHLPKSTRKFTHIRVPHAKLKIETELHQKKIKLIECLRPPYFIITMIFIMVCIHLQSSPELYALLEWSPRSWRRQPWRVISYGAVHASTAHLALNALVALAVGWRLEREQSWWRVGALWAGGVTGGALGVSTLQPAAHVVGASAGVYALLMAHLPNVALRYGHVPLWWFRPLGVLALTASDACGAGGEGQQVAWAAHALGALVGIPLGFLLFTGENRNCRPLLTCRLLSGAAMTAGLLAALLYYTCLENE